jgi:GNAT superfamily N-acetyltransferase
MSTFEIRSDSPGVAPQIESELLASLRARQPQAVNGQFTLSVEATDGGLLGGLTAVTSYGWLLIRTLWVHEQHRHRGIGRTLLTSAERKGREQHCHGAWLDTSSDEARAFYLCCGYREFGILANRTGQHPSQHRRWFLQKQWNEQVPDTAIMYGAARTTDRQR